MNWKYKIECADANDEDRPGTLGAEPKDENWHLVATGETAEQVLDSLIEALNDDAVSTENTWFRCKKDGKVVGVE